MTDVVERLRKVECVERELAHDCDMPPEGTANWEYAETCKEAAAEIERLRAALRLVFDELGYAMPLDIFNQSRAALEGK